MIECQWADQVRPAGERDESDAIIRPILDEPGNHLLDDLDPADRPAGQFEVEGLHGAGHVHGKHDVNATGVHLGGATTELGSGQAKDQKRQHQ